MSEQEARMETARLEHQARMERAHQDRELAMANATTMREVAAIGAKAQTIVAEAAGRSRAAKLTPIMAAFETVQANKRARAMAARPTESSD